MVLGGQERHDGLAVHEAEQGDFRAVQEGLQQDRVAGGQDGVDVPAGGGAGFGDHNTLAAGQAVVLDHVVRAKAVEGGLDVRLGGTGRDLLRAGGAHAGGGHDVLGKGLGALDLGRACRRPEDRNPALAQRVRHAVDQGNLRPHHDKIRGDVHRELRHPRGIPHLGVLRVHCGHLRVRRGAGSDVQIGYGGVCFQAGEQGVFAAARADNEDTHAVHLNGR